MTPRPVVISDLLHAAVSALGGVERLGQLRMAEAVADALRRREHLLVQAGTGTGKSLAYLIPALAHGRRVVVATATLALQRQLVERDLPRAVEALADPLDRRPSFAILKGRANYLCRHRLHEGAPDDQDALFGPSATSALGREVLRLREWAQETDTGDRDDLAVGVGERAWAQLSVSSRECLGASACPYAADCFAEQARERARRADVVVTNHSLLAIDALQGLAVLPDHDAVIVDEAHELVSRVTGVATWELTAAGVRRTARRVGRLAPDRVADDLYAAAEELETALGEIPPGRLDPVGGDLMGVLERVRDAAREAVGALGRRAGRERGGDGGQESSGDGAARRQALAAAETVYATAERLVAGSRSDVAWVARHERWGTSLQVAPLTVAELLREALFGRHTVVLTSATLTLGGSFHPVARSVGLLPAPDGTPATVPGSDSAGSDSAGSDSAGSDSADRAGAGVSWVGIAESSGGNSGGVDQSDVDQSDVDQSGVDQSDVDQSDSDRDGSHDGGSGAGVAGAGVAGAGVAGAGVPAAGRLTGDSTSPVWHGLDVGSPFDYSRQGILYVARHLPPPGRDGIGAATLDELTGLLQASGGRALGLFSSMRAARAAAEAMRARLDLPLLCQGEDALSALLRAFAADVRTCLFGTLSLWQGVDVPGPSCQLVVIDRIPFPRPDDPLVTARAQTVTAAGGNGFMAVSAAHAALLLAQGSGRLIRSVGDRGVVAVLDPRLATARYAGFLRTSLPDFWYTTDPRQVRRSLAAIDGSAASAYPSTRVNAVPEPESVPEPE